MVEAKHHTIDIEHAELLLQEAGGRRRSHLRLTRFVVLFLLVAIGVCVVPWSGGHGGHSIEERTHRILTRTPLIGWFLLLPY